MDQIMQLQNNLRQVKQNLNSLLGQINQQLTSSEQIAQNIGTQLIQQRNQPIGGQFGVSQYQPTTTGTFGTGTVSSLDQPSMVKGGGVNQFGAQYSSDHVDEDLGAQSFVSRSQYNPIQAGQTFQTGRNNYWDTPSMVRNTGVNQFGAKYSSGHQDHGIGQSYYQMHQGAQSFAGRSQYNPNLNNVSLSGSNQFVPAQSFTGRSQYNPVQANQTFQSGRNNYWDTPSMVRNAGVNSFGAQYNSGHLDHGIGQSYYQMHGTNTPIRSQFGGMEAGSLAGNSQYGSAGSAGSMYTGGQYGPMQNRTAGGMGGSAILNSVSNANTGMEAGSMASSYDQPSMVRNYGGNQYGAMSSGKQDEDVGQSYYQSGNNY